MACGCGKAKLGVTAAALDALRAAGEAPMPSWRVARPDGSSAVYDDYPTAAADAAASGGTLTELAG